MKLQIVGVYSFIIIYSLKTETTLRNQHYKMKLQLWSTDFRVKLEATWDSNNSMQLISFRN